MDTYLENWEISVGCEYFSHSDSRDDADVEEDEEPGEYSWPFRVNVGTISQGIRVHQT